MVCKFFALLISSVDLLSFTIKIPKSEECIIRKVSNCDPMLDLKNKNEFPFFLHLYLRDCVGAGDPLEEAAGGVQHPVHLLNQE